MAEDNPGADRLALITGASSGIGFELARQFAQHGFEILIAAEDDELRQAEAALAAKGATVTAVRTDLSTPAGVEELLAALGGRQLAAAAINAGIGNSGAFIDIPLADEQRLLGLNIGATVHLAKRLLPAMVMRGSGRMLFTTSVAAKMPGPYYATYAASKAFVLSFAEALRYEVKDSGVTITALMPGPTDTEFFDRAGMDDTPVANAKKDDPAEVAADGFEALMAGKDSVVAGSVKNKAQVAGGRLMSESAKAGVHARMTKPADQ
ncbi:MAG: SDR family NAD(P)-dependent oxidoreductase [Jatrophihabitantaceae bacterium]